MRILVTMLLAVTVGVTTSAQPAKPIVYVLSTGGTIAGSGSSSTDLSNYKPGAILGEQLVKAVPQISQIADVRVDKAENCFPMVPSGAAHNEMILGDEKSEADKPKVTDAGLALV